MICRLLACLAAVASAAAIAQPPAANELVSTYSASISYTADGEVEKHGRDLGDVNVTVARGGFFVGKAVNEHWRWNAGPIFEYAHFDAARRAPLPEEGYVSALHLGADWQINDRWALRAHIRPGFYSDFEDISFGDFNAPFLAAVTYAANSNLLWVLGIGVNLRSDLGTIGGPGVRWQFAENWTLDAVLPRPTIEYSLNRNLQLYAGGEWKSSYFRLSEDFGSDHGRRDLNDDDFTYRELRAIGGVRWMLSRSLRVDLEGGYAFNRKFEFRDADLEIEADGAPFVQLGIGGSF